MWKWWRRAIAHCCFCRAVLCKRGLCRHAVSFRLSVCPSQSWILWKRIIVSSHFFFTVFSQTILVFCIPNLIAIFRRYPINGGVECRWGRKKSRFWTNSWLSINDWWSANNKCDGDHAVYRTDGDASVNLCLSQPAWTTTTKKRKHNRIYLYAAVNLKCK